MQPYIIDNIFDKVSSEVLQKYINNQFETRDIVNLQKNTIVNTEISIVQKHNGRLIMHLNAHKIPKDIYQQIFNYALSIDKDVIPHAYIYSRYSKKYGDPKLIPHIDQSNTDFTIDYQLQSNTKWPLIVENQEYVLNDGQALFLNSSENYHWRKPKIFNDDEYIDMIFFHFINKNKKNDYKKPGKIRGDYIFNYNLEKKLLDL